MTDNTDREAVERLARKMVLRGYNETAATLRALHARICELEASQDDHALMAAYQRGYLDGWAKAEEAAAALRAIAEGEE